MSTARTKITDAIGFLSSKWRNFYYLAEDSKIIWDMKTMVLVVDGFLVYDEWNWGIVLGWL